MQNPKKIKVFALIGIACLVFFFVILPVTRNWCKNHFIKYPSVIPVRQWKKFSSVEGKFSVWFPGDPEYTNVTDSISGIDVSMPCFFIWDRQVEYSVGYIDYSIFPENIVKNLKKFSARQKFDLSQSAVAREVGRIVYQKDITVEGCPSRDFEYVVVGKVNYSGRIRLILKNDRLYQLIVIFLTANPHPVDRDTFFNSFRLNN